MASSFVSWWKGNSARHTYVYALFLISLPFTIFNTYAVYQLQVVGFLVGTDAAGAPCTTYCLVPFGNQTLDLNSVLLYMNAMTFGFGGFVMIFVTAYADFWKNKSLLITFLIICYGAFSAPAYWLRNLSLADFNSLLALYVVFNVITFILIALLNIYIPHCMRMAKEKKVAVPEPAARLTYEEQDVPVSKTARDYGFTMSILGGLALPAAAIIILIIVIILARTLSETSAQSAGLLVTTIIGFTTLAGALPCYWGLPTLPAKTWPASGGWKTALLELFTPYREMLLRKHNMLFLLLAYTFYTDTLFALFSITGQLYYTEIKPGTLEYSLYTLAGNLFNFGFTLAFYLLQVQFRWNLGKCLIFGYALILVVPIWGCIGLAGNVDFGFKNRWEFYVQLLISYLSQSIVNPTFRLLYSELVPKGEEIMWFGLQVILSCATTWVNYVASGPLQNSTHELRFPMVLCLVFFIAPVVLECMRATMGLFKRDKLRWLQESDPPGAGPSVDSAEEIQVMPPKRDGER